VGALLFGGGLLLALMFAGGDEGDAPGPGPGPGPSPGPGPGPGPEPGPTPDPDDVPPDNMPSVDELAGMLCTFHLANPGAHAQTIAASALDALRVPGDWPPHPQSPDWQWQLWGEVVPVAEQVKSGQIVCDESDPAFIAGSKTCKGEPYNAALWSDPASVVTELLKLGFGKGAGDNLSLTSSFWREQVKLFQAVARSLGLPGLAGTPPGAVDGIVGACTLLALTAARARRKAGTWDAGLATNPPPPPLSMGGSNRQWMNVPIW